MSNTTADFDWQAFIEAIPCIITQIDTNGDVLRQFNAAGAPLDTSPGDPFLPDAAIANARFETQNGATWYEHHTNSLPDGSQVILSQDITERKQLEAQFAQLGRRFQAILDNASDAIAISTFGSSYDDNDLLAVNQRMMAITGYNLEELRSIPPSEHLVEEDVTPALDNRAAIEIGQHNGNGIVERRAYRKDGTVYHVESMRVAVRDEEGQIVEVIVIGRDITERKQRERDLINARLAAEAALKARDVFVANMTHELRSPLVSILAYVRILMAQMPTDEDREPLRFIDYSARHLSRLVDDLLDLSRVEAGFDALRPVDFNLPYLCNRLEGMLRIQAMRKGLDLHFDTGTDIPVTVRLDEVKLKQILINLVDNAIKYTQQGSVVVFVRRASNARLRFTVSDTGQGIPPDLLPYLLEPFTRGETDQPGTGLGLSISQRLTEAMGGALSVESGTSGTSMIVELPYEPVAEPAGAGITDESDQPSVPNLMPLPDDWLKEMYAACLAGDHRRAAALTDEIGADYPDVAAALLQQVSQYWTTRVADWIAPLLNA